MKPKLAKAWACGICGKVFLHSVHGKMVAALCCTCPNCQGPSDRYRGTTDKLCAKCKNVGRLDLAQRNFDRAKQDLDAAHKYYGSKKNG